MPAQPNTFPCHGADWSSFQPTWEAADIVSFQGCEEWRDTAKFDVCWQRWSKSPFTTNLRLFSRLVLINISLILKLDASIMGLMSIDRQNNTKQNCFPHRGTKSASRCWFHRGRLLTLQGDARLPALEVNSGFFNNKSMGFIEKSFNMTWVIWDWKTRGRRIQPYIQCSFKKTNMRQDNPKEGFASTRAQHPAGARGF